MSDLHESAALSARRLRTRTALLAVLAEYGALSRSDLGRLTGLSRSAVSSAVADLRAEGAVTEQPAPTGPVTGRGRPAAVVTLSRDTGLVLGLDLGHAHITAAVGTGEGTVLGEATALLDIDDHPQRALDTAADLAAEAMQQAGCGPEAVGAAAAGIPAAMDLRTRAVRAPTILAKWIGLDPAAELARRLRMPVAVANDAEMGARGERALGAGRGLNDLIYVKASHGVGSGLVLGGQFYRGATGLAGEIGHIQLPGATNWCRCGNRGCLETVVSVAEVRRRLTHVLASADRGNVPEEIPPLDELAGRPAAARVITDAGRTLGRVLADLVNCLNPAAIIIGGELGQAGAPLVTGVRESIDRYAQPAVADAVEITAGTLGVRAELHGALVTAADTRRTVA
ncbi:ROK family transcriptional regulator [Streptomyces sp. NRRL B-24484]|uniref:ROK family transcriptional regulator n=1 Tax=Streptomyces sp. NRRL B-24484 TaxID=1463833 RepID=UPI0004C12066|nr:ROK family transcriptional regulator [Streptomyces sp. NRRL B-24484]